MTVDFVPENMEVAYFSSAEKKELSTKNSNLADLSFGNERGIRKFSDEGKL